MKIGHRLSSLFVVLGVLAGLSTTMNADTVFLKSGDRLTGSVVKLAEGKLVLKTDFADAINITWDKVQSVTVDQPVFLPTRTGKLAVSKVERTENGFEVTTPGAARPSPEAELTVIRSPAEQQAYEESLHPGWTQDWAGGANVGLGLARGNSDTTSFTTGLDLARTTLNDKTALYLATLYSRDGVLNKTSANANRGGIRYDHNIDKKRIFVYGSGDFGSDQLQHLNIRSIIGGGIGYHVINKPTQTLDVLGGLAWTHENYDTIPNNNFLALQLGEQYMLKIRKNTTFNEQAFVYPDMNDLGEYRFALDAGLTTKIASIFTWNATVSERYTSEPPPDTKGNDLIFTTGLGISIGKH